MILGFSHFLIIVCLVANLLKKEQYIKHNTTQNNSTKVKGKGKVHPKTGHKGQDWEWMNSSTLSLTSVLDGGKVVNATSLPLYPQERPGTHCIGGWLAPGTIWTGEENIAPHQDSNPGPSTP